MSLIADIKKLRELEQKAKKDYVENGNWYRYNAEKLVPAMLSVLECFREGDAELIKAAINGLKDTVEGLDLCPEEYDEEIEGLRRLQKAASLMEQEIIT